MPDDGRPRLHVGGRTYLLEGLLARGQACGVYRGRWVIRLGELVVLELLRSLADQDLLRREWAVLRHLEESTAQGAGSPRGAAVVFETPATVNPSRG